MEKPDFTKMMNDKGNLKPVKLETKLEFGTLIGFRGQSSKEEKCSAAYPVWAKKGDEIQFVLSISDEGRPLIDNAWIRGESILINEEPIIVDVVTKNPQTVQDRLKSFFAF
jgi:hypothetical protein